MEKEQKKIVMVLIVIMLIILIFIILSKILKKDNENYIYNENLFNVQRVNGQVLTQGDIVIYEFKEKESVELNSKIDVQIINLKGTVIGNATVKDNRIFVDTSFLLSGTYRIKILYNSQQMIVKDDFTVILIDC